MFTTSTLSWRSNWQVAFSATAILLTILGYITLSPTVSVIPEVGEYNEKRVLQIGLFVLLGSALLSERFLRQVFLSTVAQLPRMGRWGLSLVLMGGILSAFQAPASFHAFLEVGHIGLLFVTAGIVAAAVHRAPRRTERWIFGAVALGVVLYAVFFGVGYGMHLRRDQAVARRGHKLRQYPQLQPLPDLDPAAPRRNPPVDTKRLERRPRRRAGLDCAVVGTHLRIQRPGHHRRDGGGGRRRRTAVSPTRKTVAAGAGSGAARRDWVVLPSLFDGRGPAGGREVFRGGDVFQASPIMEDKPGDGLGTPLAGSRADALRVAPVSICDGWESPQCLSAVACRVGSLLHRHHEWPRRVGRVAVDGSGKTGGGSGVGCVQRSPGGARRVRPGGGRPRHGERPARDAHQPGLSRAGRRVGVGAIPV